MCLLIYWNGLRAWFQMDDFAWLALHRRVHDLPGFFAALFQPLAQGTIRPWSERLFFLAGWQFFGFDAVPLRAAVFLTQFANLFLLTALTKRLTGSALAGLLAPLLWVCNSNLYVPMTWTAAYNQIQCAFFLLLALWLWIRYLDTGERKFFTGQWIVFLLGFGALEINVVYPALAALYSLCFERRRHLLETLPMFVASAIYAAVHRAVAPAQATDIYRMYFDASIPAALFTYLRWTFGVERYAWSTGTAVWPHQTIAWLTGGALLVFVVIMLARRHWLAAFGIGWFFIVLSPVLPLRNHVTDYYLTMPLIGLAIVAAWAVALAVRRGVIAASVAIGLVLLYSLPQMWMARGMTNQYAAISRRARTLVRSVAFADRIHPSKTLVLRNVDNDLFWAAWWDNPFQIFGRRDIYVSAESEPGIAPFPETGTLSRFFLSQREVLEGMKQNRLVAYDLMRDARLRNVTYLYREMLARDPDLPWPNYINFGRPFSGVYLGKGWWEPEAGFRWISRQATFRIRGPATGAGELVLTGSCQPQQVAAEPLRLTVTAAGHTYPPSTIEAGNLQWSFRYPLKPVLARQPSMPVILDVERTMRVPQDARELGLILITAEVVN